MPYNFTYNLFFSDGSSASFTITSADTPSGGPYAATSITGTYRGLTITGLNSTYYNPDNLLGTSQGFTDGVDSTGVAFDLVGGKSAIIGFNNSGFHTVDNTQLNPDETQAPAQSNHPFVGNYQTTACFAAGTLIRTPSGEVAVEALAEGDLVLTQAGEVRPVRWVGYTIVHPHRSPEPWNLHPIRVRAGAVAEGVPYRDLIVSPGHALLIGDVLINAGELVNGGTIVQEEAEVVRYYHVELDSHDLLIADGMPCESYLDDGNRASFIGNVAYLRRHGRIDRASSETCRPLVKDGPLLVEARAALLARALASGRILSDALELRLEAGAAAIAPLAIAGSRWWFLLPPGAPGEVRLRASAATPSRVVPGHADDRTLGVALGELRVDGTALELASPAFGAGFHSIESDGHASWRWMGADATLHFAPGARMIELRVQIAMPHLRRAGPAAAADVPAATA